MLDQPAALARLSAFLGFPLTGIEVHPDKVARWRREPETVAGVADLLAGELAELGYEPAEV